MEVDEDAAEDERTIELSSIAAIFPEIVLDPKSPYTATLDLAVTPAAQLKVHFQQSAESAAPGLPTPPKSADQDDGSSAGTATKSSQVLPSTTLNADAHDLEYLPPLTLHISLPENYPSECPPMVSLSATPQWVPRKTLNTLRDDCARLWEEVGKDQVVYTYIDHVQQAAENAFGLATADIQLSSDMKLALLDFNLKTKQEVFEKGTFDCGVCLEPKKGTNCHRLMLCGHVFCVACLQDFYNNCIVGGDVDNVKCLAPDCGKEAGNPDQSTPKRRKQDRTLNPSELLQIPIGQENVQRYVRFKRKRKLEADKSTIYCPRQWCQGAARSKRHPKPVDPMNDFEESGTDSESEAAVDARTKAKKQEEIPMSERLAICEDCSFAFCSVCKKGWHGELANCNPRRQTELNEEEQASISYIQQYSTPCPTCSAPSQKTMGCNHMICFKCATHFCYLCSSYLMPENPYRHFNDPKSPCYMRLWELEGGDGADVDVDHAGGPDWAADSDDDAVSSSSDEEVDQNFPDFDGDDDLDDIFGDEDTSDDEPAPDQRRRDRPMQIELVNAAGQRVIHNIPQIPRQAPPPAPAPPAPAGRGGRRQMAPNRQWPQQNQRQARRQVQGRGIIDHVNRGPREDIDRNIAQPLGAAGVAENGGPAPRPEVQPEEDEREMVRVAAAPGQGNAAAQQPAPVRWMGLERFLELAHRDQEDEWDSDELDEEVEDVQEIAARARANRRGRRQ